MIHQTAGATPLAQNTECLLPSHPPTSTRLACVALASSVDVVCYANRTKRMNLFVVFSVWVLDDLVGELERQGRGPEDARSKVDKIMADMQTLTTELFRVRTGKTFASISASRSSGKTRMRCGAFTAFSQRRRSSPER